MDKSLDVSAVMSRRVSEQQVVDSFNILNNFDAPINLPPKVRERLEIEKAFDQIEGLTKSEVSVDQTKQEDKKWLLKQ